jgi:hypothetical protein
MRRLTLAAILTTLVLAMGANTVAASKPLGKIIVNSGESIRCPAASAGCVVSIQATARNRHNRSVSLGHATIAIAPAATARLVFRLSGAGKRLLLTRGPLRAWLTVAIRDGSAAPIVSTHPITIGVPRRHGRRR